ncbi:phage tail protein, partial [Citrobacter meridianamericanus]
MLKNKQPLDASLTSLSSLEGAHNKFPYFSGPETMTLGDITDIGKGIISRETLAEFYLYVGIKTAGLRDVGTGAN